MKTHSDLLHELEAGLESLSCVRIYAVVVLYIVTLNCSLYHKARNCCYWQLPSQILVNNAFRRHFRLNEAAER